MLEQNSPTPNRPKGQEYIAERLNTIFGVLGYDGTVSFRPHPGNDPTKTGWAWDMNSHVVYYPESAFEDPEYEPEWYFLALSHELEAHHAPGVREPSTNRQELSWTRSHPAAGIFTNILADIAGNRKIVSKMQGADRGWHGFYKRKLFVDHDYSSQKAAAEGSKPLPRHMQFLYKILRDEFVYDETSVVDPEVAEVIDQLRHWRGDDPDENTREADVIDFATQPMDTPYTYMKRADQMKVWRQIIWPRYLELYALDKADPRFQNNNEAMQNGSQGSSGDTEGSSDQSGGSPDFSEFYGEYEEEHHPKDVMDDETSSEVAKNCIPQTEKQKPKTESKRTQIRNAEQARADREGVSVETIHQYNQTLRAVEPILEDMASFFEQFLSENKLIKNRLRARQTEGALLDPNHLAQTYIQMRTDPDNEPPAFMDYKPEVKMTEAVGKVDFWLIVDCSGSMQGQKAKVAAQSAVAVLEGLDLFNTKVKEKSEEFNIELDYNAQTGIVIFGDGATVIKPLSNELTNPDRYSSVDTIVAANEGGTNDYLGIGHVNEHYRQNPPEEVRNRVAILICDGDSNNPAESAAQVNQLRRSGVMVIPIYVMTDGPDPAGRRIDDIEELPEVISKIAKEAIIK